MANEKNLKPFTSNQDKKEASKNGRKGGKASGEAKRKRKNLKECMTDLLELPVTDKKQLNKMKRLGLEESSINNKSLLAVSLFVRATKFFDVSAFKEIRNLIGEDTDEGGGQLSNLIEGLKEDE